MKNEKECAGFIKGKCYENAALGQSFPAIVATGKNAAILHYHANNEDFQSGELLLMDFGVRLHNMPADVSRTVPVNGRFNPLQRCLYNCVLSAQQCVEEHAKAGVSIDFLNELCWNHLEEQLNIHFFSKGGVCKRPYEKMPHFVGHLIGHMVHDGDPAREYRKKALEPGMVMSNEPGLYGEFQCEIEGKMYKEHCGIRIEDDLLITETGCENVTQNCPKSCSDIEAIMLM